MGLGFAVKLIPLNPPLKGEWNEVTGDGSDETCNAARNPERTCPDRKHRESKDKYQESKDVTVPANNR